MGCWPATHVGAETKVVLLLAAYDKSEDPSARRQQKEIELARRRVTDWQQRRRS
jgi:hypothetical protein